MVSKIMECERCGFSIAIDIDEVVAIKRILCASCYRLRRKSKY